MAGQDLERTIGELSGQLGMLVPALERFEDRQRQAETSAERARAELQQVRKERDHDAKKASENFNDLFTLARKLDSKGERLESRINALEADLGREKAKRSGVAKRIWEIVLLLLSGAVGAFFTKMVG